MGKNIAVSLLAFFGVLLSVFSTQSQGVEELNFETVGDTSSIPDGIAMALAQDKSGFIWIGTQSGLIRYDGYNFRKFTHNPKNLKSISGNFITKVEAADNGNIYIGTLSQGFSIFNPETEEFQNYNNSNVQLSANKVTAISSDNQGGVWIGTTNGLNYLTLSSGKIKKYHHIKSNPNSLLDNHIRSLLLTPEGDLWVGTNKGLNFKKRNSQIFETIHSNSLLGKKIQSLFLDSNNNLWLGMLEYGGAKINMKDNDIKLITAGEDRNNTLSHPNVRSIIQTSEGNIWMATYGGGINEVDPKTAKILRQFRFSHGSNSTINSDTIGSQLVDSSGLVWIGTWGGGINRVNLENRAFRSLRYSASLPYTLSHPDISSIAELDNGNLLFGTRGHDIDVFTPGKGVIKTIRSYFESSKRFRGGTIKAIAESLSGKVWVGKQESGIYNFENKSDAISPYKGKNEITDISIRKFLFTQNGSLWIGTREGLNYWDKDNELFSKIQQQSQDGVVIEFNDIVEALAEQKGIGLWVGTRTGLYLLPDGKKELLKATFIEQADGRMYQNAIFGLLIDSHNQLWIAGERTLDRVIFQDAERLLLESIDQKLGGEGQSFWANLLEDEQGRIWTGKGVLNTKTWQYRELDRADGVDIGVNWYGSYLKSSDGRLWYGGTKGVLIVEPNKLTSWKYNPPVVISEMKVDEKAIFVEKHKSVVLSAESKSFSVEFSALDYSSPLKNRYAYRLSGYDEHWIETDANNRHATYTNLNPGDYELHIKGSNRLGIWSDNEIHLKLKKLPFWYQTWWFIALAILCCSLVLMLLYNKRLEVLTKQQEILKDDAAKIKDFSLAMQEFATLDDLLWSIANYVGQKLGYKDCVIYLVENERLIQKAAYGPKNPKDRIIKDRIEIPKGKGIVGSVAETGVAEIISDTSVEPRYISEQNSGRSELAVPITFEGKVIAVIDSESEFKNTYTIMDRDFLQVIANIASSKIVSSKYHQHLEDRAAEIQLLGEIGRDLTSNLNIKQVYKQIHTALSVVLDAHSFSLYLLNNNELHSIFKIENKIVFQGKSIVFFLDEVNLPAVWCVNNREAIIVNKLNDWKKYFYDIPPSSGDDTVTVVYQPLFSGDEIIGCFTVQSLEENAYDSEQLDMIKILSSYIAIALSNAKGYAELEDTLEELKSTQQQLIQSSKMASLGTMTAGIAHEVNNPTNFTHAAVYMMKDEIIEIKSFLKQLAGGDSAEPEVLQSFDDKFTKLVELTNTASEGTNRIKTIVEDLRTFSRLDDAKQAKVKIPDLINSTVHLVKTQYDSIVIETLFNYSPLLTCFPSKLSQVFMNIIVNACQAIEVRKSLEKNLKGKVVIKAIQANNQLVISFEDNGCGMKEETLHRMFEPFYTTKDVGGGTGLGMAISFGIIEEHGGIIEVESVVNQGSKITIHFSGV